MQLKRKAKLQTMIGLTTILSGLIWIQTVYKSYQQITKIAASRQRVPHFNKIAVWRTAISAAAESHDLEVWSTLTLSLHSRVMGSAHQLTERNIWVKFYENGPKGSGDMERTQNSKVNPLTLTCDLESRWLGRALHTVSLWGTF